MPKNYIDRKNAQRAQTQSQVAETQKLIDKKSGELSALGEALQSPINLSNVNISATNGYSAMFNTITDLINSTEDYKNRPIKTETLEMWFYIALGVIFEIVAVLTAYLGQLKSGTKMVSVKTEVLPEMGSDLTGMTIRPQVIDAIRKEYGDYRDDRDNRGPQSEIRGKRQIGFQAPERASECEERKDKSAEGAKPCVTQRGQDIDNKILGKYLDYIYANVKEDNSIPGYQVTANDLSKLHPELKLSCDYVRKLKNHCEQLKILKSDSERRATYIIRPRDEVKLCG
jgi:hypothetical protein